MPTALEIPAKSTKQPHSAGKYLTFRLEKESYGVGVLKVREIIRMMNITPVPQMPAYVRGVINLRGKVIPVIDLRLKFGMQGIANTDSTCIVVVHIMVPSGTNTLMGLVVDAVEEVANISADEIESTPDFGMKLETNYILGMAKVRGSVKTLLDIDQVISESSLETIAPSTQSN
jgi:purine-binding chemotaxis protein CheW